MREVNELKHAESARICADSQISLASLFKILNNKLKQHLSHLQHDQKTRQKHGRDRKADVVSSG